MDQTAQDILKNEIKKCLIGEFNATQRVKKIEQNIQENYWIIKKN